MEVKSHPWFEGFPWDKLEKKQIIAPFIPEQVDNFDVKVTNDGWKDEESDKMKESALLLRRETVQDLFKGYYYDQSFEGFTFGLEEKVKPIGERPKRPSHRTAQPSPKRNILNNYRSSSGKAQPFNNIQNMGKNNFAQPIKRQMNPVFQKYKPVSRTNSSSLNSSQTRKVAGKIAVPKGPFYYRNESKKISQI